MRRYDAILFDLDNTLYDYDTYWRQRLEWSLEPVQAAYPQLDITTLIGQAMRQHIYAGRFEPFLQQAGVHDSQVCALALARYRQNHYERLRLFPGAADMLQQLHEHYRLGLITNGPVHSQRPKIENLGLHDLIDVLIISEEVQLAKPDPAIFHLALQRLGVPARRALYVGDSVEHDICGAHGAGLDVIWIDTKNRELPPGVAPPRGRITYLSGLLALLHGEHPAPAD